MTNVIHLRTALHPVTMGEAEPRPVCGVRRPVLMSSFVSEITCTRCLEHLRRTRPHAHRIEQELREEHDAL